MSVNLASNLFVKFCSLNLKYINSNLMIEDIKNVIDENLEGFESEEPININDHSDDCYNDLIMNTAYEVQEILCCVRKNTDDYMHDKFLLNKIENYLTKQMAIIINKRFEKL